VAEDEDGRKASRGLDQVWEWRHHQLGLGQVGAWVAADDDRHAAFKRGDWWFLDVQAVAIVQVVVSDEVIGQFGYCSMLFGGIESDAPRDYLDQMSSVLVREVTETLADLGLVIPDGIDTPYVQDQLWLMEALAWATTVVA
jgi:hypothetical protein